MKLDSVYETENSFYIVLELFSGGNLKDFIRENGILNERKAASIMKPILKTLSYLNKMNIIHRDIKPDNILFRQKDIFKGENQVAIADFGLAAFIDTAALLFPRCGTPGFASPEVAKYKVNDGKYDDKCDLYSFGVTLYFTLTGCLPYPGKRPLINENKEVSLFFSKSEIYTSLTREGSFLFSKSCLKFLIVKDLLKRLICPSKSRINFEDALNHEFFKLYEDNDEIPSEPEDEDVEITPFLNMINFNKYFSYFINCYNF